MYESRHSTSDQQRKSDFPSLANVFYQSFHPVSAYMRQAIPDTPLVRDHWEKTNAYSLQDPEVGLMVVADKSTQPEHVIALCRFRAPSSQTSKLEYFDAGTWSRIPLTTDHDAKLFNDLFNFIILCQKKVMTGKKYYMAELLATSHEYKGSGAGRQLVEWVCSEADKERMPIFVGTNRDIVKFYEKFGFDVVETLAMPNGYEEFVMVRPAQGTI